MSSRKKSPQDFIEPGGSDWVYYVTTNGDRIKIDKSDVDLVLQLRWRVTYSANKGKHRVIAGIEEKGRITTITLGKYLMKPPHGQYVYPRRFVEGLDYRRENLIVCNMQDRQRMAPRLKRTGSSRFKGVSWVEHLKKWKARITYEGRQINLGIYEDEEEAAESYNRAAKEYFGEFAYENLTTQVRERRKNKAKSKNKS